MDGNKFSKMELSHNYHTFYLFSREMFFRITVKDPLEKAMIYFFTLTKMKKLKKGNYRFKNSFPITKYLTCTLIKKRCIKTVCYNKRELIKSLLLLPV